MMIVPSLYSPAEGAGQACAIWLPTFRLAAVALLFHLFPQKAHAQLTNIQYYTSTTNGQITITQFTANGIGPLVIPATIDSLPVTTIGESSFEFQAVTSVTIPDSVTTIANYAFENCAGLASVTLGNGVTSIGVSSFAYDIALVGVTFGTGITTIGESAFYGCTRLGNVTIPATVTTIGAEAFANSDLTTITIPASVTTIGESPFYNCASLTTISVSPQNPAYTSANGALFDANLTTLLEYPGAKAGTYAIPNSVTSIGESALYGCRSLVGVTIPSSVTSMGSNAFSNCTSLTTVTIPASITTIGADAFSGCSQLTSAFFLGNAPTIGQDAFADSSTFKLYYPASATGFTTPNWTYYSGFSFGELEFSLVETAVITDPSLFTTTTTNNQVTITGYTGPTGPVVIPPFINGLPVTTIGSYAFENQGSAPAGPTSVVFPSSVTTIQYGAFAQDTGLTSIEIPGTIITVGPEAFNGCSGLTGVLIDNGVQTLGGGAYLGQGAFALCPNLTTLAIPASVTNLGEAPLSNMTGLTSITVSPQNTAYTAVNGILFNANQTTLIGYPQNMPGTSFTLPSSVTTVGVAAFEGSVNLNVVVIPNSVATLSDQAFAACNALTNVAVGNGVTSIGEDTFGGCPFRGITLPNSLISIGDGAFEDCPNLLSITIPNSVTSIGSDAFYECFGLTNVTIGSGVTSIGEDAFIYCSKLTRSIFLGNAPSMSTGIFFADAANFAIGYLDSSTGFTTPTWVANPYDTYSAYPIGTFSEWSGYYQVTAVATATPQNDGVPNLLKYLYDIDPSTPMSATDRAALPTVGSYATTSPANQYLTLTYRANPLATGITVHVETSSDLQNWSTPSNLTVATMGTDTTTGDPMMQAQVPFTSTKQFIRLQITQP